MERIRKDTGKKNYGKRRKNTFENEDKLIVKKQKAVKLSIVKRKL